MAGMVNKKGDLREGRDERLGEWMSLENAG
ncbi:hypothetical protein SAMN04488505_104143 [Chitinophaga rupis]|uniref:Uncharacterized protein n=1 Tax=Chitinophaga rupis TaxID=573321 RepID=A0A1H7XP77_9BACT|nr:hypothetical protein SAMN04488505_104143 [Chitinophaga rupis]